MLMGSLEEDWGFAPRAGAAIDLGSAPGPSWCRICGSLKFVWWWTRSKIASISGL